MGRPHPLETSQVKGLKEIQTAVETITKNFDVGTTSLNAISVIQANINVGTVFSDYAMQVNGATRFFKEDTIDNLNTNTEEKVYIEIPTEIYDYLYVEG